MQFENYGWKLNRVAEIMCNALDKWLSLEFVILWFWIMTILFWLPPIQINWAGLTTAASCWSASNIIYTRRVHGLIMQNKADFKCLWPWVTNCFENINTCIQSSAAITRSNLSWYQKQHYDNSSRKLNCFTSHVSEHRTVRGLWKRQGIPCFFNRKRKCLLFSHAGDARHVGDGGYSPCLFGYVTMWVGASQSDARQPIHLSASSTLDVTTSSIVIKVGQRSPKSHTSHTNDTRRCQVYCS